MTGDAAIGIDLNSIDLQSLSRRIVDAARLAVAVHLYESVSQPAAHGVARDTTHAHGRHIRIGGAGPFVPDERGRGAKDGDHPQTRPATADRSRRPSIFFPDADGPAADDRRAGPR